MENDPPAAAARALREIQADRVHLVSRVAEPRLLLVLIGALGAAWVATAATTSPGESYEAPPAGWLAVLGVVMTTVAIRHRTGIRLRTFGVRAALASLAALMCCLMFFSVSLGLTAAGLTWAVTITTAATFVLVTWLSRMALRWAVAEIARG